MEKATKKDTKNKYVNLLPYYFKEEKVQNFTTLSLTLLAFSIFGFFAINPTIATIVHLRKQVSDSRFVNQKLEEKITNLGILQQKYAKVTQDVPVVLKSLPKTPTVPLLTAQVLALAQNKHVALTQMQILQVELAKSTTSPTQNAKASGSFGFILEGQGSYSDVVSFLSSLVNLERIITIDALSFGKRGNGNVLEVSLRGKAYFKQ